MFESQTFPYAKGAMDQEQAANDMDSEHALRQTPD